jgi:glycosyltransferase involved in cell wall biosynthesis
VRQNYHGRAKISMSCKKKVIIVTPDCFLDVDLPIVKELVKYIRILWIVTFAYSPVKNRIYNINEVKEFSKVHNINLKVFEFNFRKRNPMHLYYAFQIAITIKQFRPSTVYFNNFGNLFLPVINKLMNRKLRHIVAVHDYKWHTNMDTFKHIMFEKIVFRIYNNFQFFSNTQLQQFEIKYQNKHCTRIPLPLKEFGEPGEISKKNKYCSFLFFGTVHHYKGLDILIDAGNKLNVKSNIKIIVAGQCDNADYYKNKVKNKAIFEFDNRIIPNVEIPNLFSSVDYVVLPYRQVTQSGPLLIALRYNSIPIVSNLPGFMEVLTPGTGLFFNSEDSESLKKIMVEAINLSANDKQKIKNSIKKLKEKNYSKELILNKYLNLLI